MGSRASGFKYASVTTAMPDRLIALILARPRGVVLAWIVLACASIGVAASSPGDIGNVGYWVPGSGSARAYSTLSRYIPGNAGATVFALVTARQNTEISSAVAGLAPLVGVTSVEEVTHVAKVAHKGEAPAATLAIFAIHLDMSQTSAEKRVPAIEAALRDATPRNASFALVGGLVVSREYSKIARHDLARAELISLPVTFLVLLVAFLSVFSAMLPVVLAAVSLLATLSLLDLVSLQTALSVFTVNTASVIALGLSIDYALFIVSRLREERQASNSLEQAIAETMRTAGRAVCISGLTVAVSLTALLAVGVGLFTSMAVGGIIASLVALLAAATLLPAAICLLGARLDRLTLRSAAAAARRGTLWHRLARVVSAHPLGAALACVVFLLVLATPAHTLRLDFRSISELPSDAPMARALRHLAKDLGPGATGPVEVMSTNPAAVSSLAAALRPEPLVAEPITGADGWYATTVILKSTPDSATANAAVTRLRHELRRFGGTTYIGGLTASNVDLTNRVASRTPLVVAIAVLVGLIALAAGLRSIVIPIKAVICSLLSVAGTLGVLMLWFSSGGGLSFFVPLFVFVLVLGLSIDYEVFLLSRVREAVQGGSSTREAVSLGLTRSARPITLAGLTLATVFAAFAVSSLDAFRQLGIGLAIAVLLDVTIVRCVLVPACIILLGRWNWWFPSLRRSSPLMRGGSSAPRAR
jgi:uncharacterized membrane protein YdfJ with MMPL/SSD domain